MNVACPQCTSVFRVDPAKVPAGGVRARCSICSGVIPVPEPSTAEVATVGSRAGGTPPTGTPARTTPATPQPAPLRTTPATPQLAPLRPTPAEPWPAPAPRRPTPAEPWPTSPPPQAVPAEPWPAPVAPQQTPPVGRPTPAPEAEWPAQTGGDWAAAATASPAPAAVPRPVTPPSSEQAWGGAPAAMPAPPTPPGLSRGAIGGVSGPGPAPTPATPPYEAPAAGPGGHVNPYLKRDPHHRAKRLARALASDIVTYYPEKHAEAVQEGTVKELFREEIEKSYEDYVTQVGAELAQATTYFQDAMNEVLAVGKRIF